MLPKCRRNLPRWLCRLDCAIVGECGKICLASICGTAAITAAVACVRGCTKNWSVHVRLMMPCGKSRTQYIPLMENLHMISLFGVQEGTHSTTWESILSNDGMSWSCKNPLTYAR